MSADKKIIPLYEIRVSVDPTGVVSQLFKVPVTFSGKNYIPQRMTKALEDEGYDYFGGNGRVPVDQVMKVNRCGMWDKVDHVSYEIHFLEGDKEKAVAMLRAFLDEKLSSMKKDMESMYEAWVTRRERPRKDKS